MNRPSRAALLAGAARRLARAGVDQPDRDARLLLRWAAGMDSAKLTTRLAEPAAPEEAARFDHAIGAREVRMPVSHITRVREFWGRSFETGPAVLDPRPETETLIAAALEGPAPKHILDLGTGSGCILATLLAEWPNATGVGTDISADALAVAGRNLARFGLEVRARLICTDWMDGLDGQFDLIVSNPPYIADEEIAGLEPEVRNYEPMVALTDGGDGLSAYRRIAGGLGPLIAPDGCVLMEVGATQAEAVTAILARAGYNEVRMHADMDGRERVVRAKKPHKTIGASINC